MVSNVKKDTTIQFVLTLFSDLTEVREEGGRERGREGGRGWRREGGERGREGGMKEGKRMGGCRPTGKEGIPSPDKLHFHPGPRRHGLVSEDF